jgi:dihydroorotase
LPLNDGTITLERSPAVVAETVVAASSALVPFHAGETLDWRLVA